MQIKNTDTSYGLISKSMHWIIGGLMIFLLYLGITMEAMPPSPDKWQAYGLHKALGILVLALVIARIIWKHIAGKMPPIETHKSWERMLSTAVHVLLYLGMIGLPLSGWVMSSAGGHPIHFFGLFEVPPIVGENKEIGDIAHSIHGLAGSAIIAAIALHFIGAAKHHILDKDSTVMRMVSKNRVISLIILLLFGTLLIAPIYAKLNSIQPAQEAAETQTDSH